MVLNKQKIIFIGIVLLGFMLRLLFIDKPYGFWHNEMVMYNQATADFPLGIINASVKYDVHFPLYQLILGIWIKTFSHNDITIRMLSVLMGTITVIMAFFTGKELKDEKLGNIFALLVAINATMIFYSQEVKFYILLVLLSTISLFFTIRIKNKNNLSSYIGYFLSNLAIIYTFTIGVLFVFAQFIVYLTYILIKNKKLLKSFLLTHLALLISSFPFMFYILTNLDKYESASWIFTSNFFTIFVLIQNYFTPVLIAIYNNPVIYIPTLAIMPIIFIYIPAAFALYGIYKALKTNRYCFMIMLVCIVFLLCEVVLSYHSGFRVLTRYTILVVSPLLCIVAIGFYYTKSWLQKTILIYLPIISIFFLIASPQSAVRGYRALGQKPVAIILKRNHINQNDTIIISLRKTDFNKYLDFKGRKFSMLQDFVYQDYAFDKTKPDKYDAFRKYIFEKKYINKGYEEYFLRNIIKPMKKGDRIFLIWDENYNSYPFKDAKHYRKYPIMTLSLSKANADTFKICNKYLSFKKDYDLEYYNIFIFQKK